MYIYINELILCMAISGVYCLFLCFLGSSSSSVDKTGFSSRFQPVHLKDWEMHVQFKIHGSGKKNLHGDGIAIWYTKERLHPGRIIRTPQPASQ